MTLKNDSIKHDFDRIARHSKNRWDHNIYYHNRLLRSLPRRTESALEIGCGTGLFSRLLADRSDKVLALDLSPEMIKIAEKESSKYTNIDYRICDITQWDFPTDGLDAVVSIATMHHLPLEEMLIKMRRALKSGGVLIILDLYQSETIIDRMFELCAVPANWILTLWHTGSFGEPPEIRKAWKEHCQRDSYLSLSKIHSICDGVLPGAIITRHLLWRYSITWSK